MFISFGWNRFFAERADREEIRLNAGDLLLFRGDLIHAGAAYVTQNTRIHAYLRGPKAHRVASKTFIVQILDNAIKSMVKPQHQCPFHGCTFASKTDEAEKAGNNVKRHIERVHRARINKKAKIAKDHR
ncbi:hypothetical protein PINS_up019284 [Pythium insidiosum]|nr:hypothetical protein PINS_up019284 [Pythium insidiosum]